MKQPNLNYLEEFFQNAELPETLDLGMHGKILNVEKFIYSHIYTLRNYSGNKRYMPFYNRLLNVYEIIKEKNHDKLRN